MKKFIFTFLFTLCLLLNMLSVNPMAQPSRVLKRGFYKIEDLNLDSNTKYTIQNASFNERIYIIIFDANQIPLQAIRLWPQSKKYNLVSLQAGYRIVVTGNGELIIS